MARYRSYYKTPTKEKENLFNFLQRNKRHGIVSVPKINEYLKKHNLRYATHKGVKKGYYIVNKRGTQLAGIGTDKNERYVRMFAVY